MAMDVEMDHMLHQRYAMDVCYGTMEEECYEDMWAMEDAMGNAMRNPMERMGLCGAVDVCYGAMRNAMEECYGAVQG